MIRCEGPKYAFWEAGEQLSHELLELGFTSSLSRKNEDACIVEI